MSLSQNKSKKIIIIQGHPDSDNKHFCHAIVDSYKRGAIAGGHSIDIVEISQLNFSLLRSKIDHENGEVPLDIEFAQKKISSADHIVIVYPLWLGEMPAMLKAFFEQLMRPGFAYNLDQKGVSDKKLTGKSARIIITMGMPALFYRLPVFGYGAHSLKSLKKGILSFVGINPIMATLIGMIESKNKNLKKKLLEIEGLGIKAI